MKKVLSIAVLLFAANLSAQTIAEKDIEEIIGRMTLEQKARMLVGTAGSNEGLSHRTAGAAGWTYPIDELGIPSINLADGPVGIRIDPVESGVKIEYDSLGIPVVRSGGGEILSARTAFCTCFPSTTALAATWDRDAARLQGEIMGDEARSYGVDVVLTPGINIMRNPLCGRNFEYYSEDPLLTGKMAASLIQGIQEKGIGTSLKHFVANNQQTGKKYNDARMTQRALREIYLRGFEICVKEAHPWTVMGSYNKIAGEFTQTNQELMLDLLRNEWGFDGLVVTDWTVRRPTADLLNARCALMMPGEEEIVEEIIEAVRSGQVSESTLDACVKDVLGVVSKSISAKGWEYAVPDLAAHAEASRRIASEGMVLLKNDNAVLPLKSGAKIALFGASAYKSIAGGTGSSNVNKAYVENIFARLGLRMRDMVIAPVESDIYATALSISLRNGKCLAMFGVVAHKVLRMFDIDADVYFADLNWKELMKAIKNQQVNFTELSKYPVVKRDLALLLDKDVPFAEVEKIAYDTEKKLLKGVSLFDVYEGKNLEAGKKSYAVSFWLQDENATLNDKQIDKIMSKLVANLEHKLGAKLR